MVLQKGSSRVCFSLLEESIPEYMQILQNVYTQNLEEIVTDDRNLYERISQYAIETAFPENTAVRLYEGAACSRCISCTVWKVSLSMLCMSGSG